MTNPCRVYTCDICGGVVEDGTPVYGLAWDEEKCLSRHYSCHDKRHKEWEATKRRLPELLNETSALLQQLKEKLK